MRFQSMSAIAKPIDARLHRLIQEEWLKRCDPLFKERNEVLIFCAKVRIGKCGHLEHYFPNPEHKALYEELNKAIEVQLLSTIEKHMK